MKTTDLNIIVSKKGLIHFIAIGGIGMSAIASVLKHRGYDVQGSDIAESPNLKRLREEGVRAFIGHSEENNLQNVALCVRSSIIKDDNVEIQYFKKHNIPIIHRSEMLAYVMSDRLSISVSGTHGKTTTTAMIGNVLAEGGLDPTVINGGIINGKGSNVYYGNGSYIVSEADESDNSFIRLPANIAVVTNIDAEHLDFYGSYDNLKKSFFQFIDQLPKDGFGVLCTDNAEVRNLLTKLSHKDTYTYGFDGEPDVKAINIKSQGFGYSFDVICSEKFGKRIINGFVTNIPGIHNVKNSLAAVVIALKLSIKEKHIIEAIASYAGVKRRFTITGKELGITFVDDYAHHPEEIIATLRAAKHVLESTGGKLFVVFQPHKYSRLQSLFERFANSFSDADILYIADVYAASEKPIEGLNKHSLVKAIKEIGKHKNVSVLDSPDLLPDIIKSQCQKNDIAMFLGAGDITKWAYEVPSKINV